MSSFSNILRDIASLPADSPMSLPGSLYTSEEYFHNEVEIVLRKGWHCLGRVDEIPNSRGLFYSSAFK